MAKPSDESDYESRLRAQHERLHPEPSWAQKARKTYQKQHGVEADKDDEGEGHQDKRLSSGTIAIERLRDVNISTQNATAVNVVAFHPSNSVPILCVGTADRRIRLYNVNNPSSRPLSQSHDDSLPSRSTDIHLLFFKPSTYPHFHSHLPHPPYSIHQALLSSSPALAPSSSLTTYKPEQQHGTNAVSGAPHSPTPQSNPEA